LQAAHSDMVLLELLEACTTRPVVQGGGGVVRRILRWIQPQLPKSHAPRQALVHTAAAAAGAAVGAAATATAAAAAGR
jgi:hypothetical protein